MNKAAAVSPPRLVSVPAQLRVLQRDAPVAVLARLIHFGGEVSDRGGAVVLFYDATAWEQMPDDRRTYVLRQLARYRNLYAVIRRGRPGCQVAAAPG